MTNIDIATNGWTASGFGLPKTQLATIEKLSSDF